MSQIVISLTASVAQYCFSHLHCSFDTVVREHLDNVDMRIYVIHVVTGVKIYPDCRLQYPLTSGTAALLSDTRTYPPRYYPVLSSNYTTPHLMSVLNCYMYTHFKSSGQIPSSSARDNFASCY